MSREYYLEMRNRYLPANLKIIFLLESPPASRKYFYNPGGSIGEPLFKAMMKLIGINPENKEQGLNTFQETGHFLVDATYAPVNELKGKDRENTILADYRNLKTDLNSLCKERSPDIILVKANICRLLEPKLMSDGFKVKNAGVIVPFPSTGHQTDFAKKMRLLY